MAKRFPHSRRQFLLAGASVASTLSIGSLAEAAVELVVIVHPDNTQSVSPSDIEAIFRTTLRHWPGGGGIVAFNLVPGSEERVSFDRAALRLTPEQVSRYWIDRRIRGGQPPPRAVSSPLLAVRLVRELRNAIGYVPASLAPSGVRMIARVRGPALVVAEAWPRDAKDV